MMSGSYKNFDLIRIHAPQKIQTLGEKFVNFSKKVLKLFSIGLEKMMAQLFVTVFPTKGSYLRFFAALYLLADFGLYPINSVISVDFCLKSSNLDVFEENLPLKFTNLKSPTINLENMPYFLSDDWNSEEKLYSIILIFRP